MEQEQSPSSWATIVWNPRLASPEERKARRLTDRAGLEAVLPIRDRLKRHLSPFMKRPGTEAAVLPEVFRHIGEAHDAFIRASVTALRKLPNDALVAAPAFDWIEESATCAVRELLRGGTAGFGEIVVNGFHLDGQSLIAYCAGANPRPVDNLAPPWAAEVSRKISKQIEALWPAEGYTRGLYLERPKRNPAHRCSKKGRELLGRLRCEEISARPEEWPGLLEKWKAPSRSVRSLYKDKSRTTIRYRCQLLLVAHKRA